MLLNRRDRRIEWAQCDPAGIVFYPQYFIIFDASTGQLFARTGLSASAIRAKYGIVGFPLIESSAKFLLPCHFDDAVTVESGISQWGRTSFTVQHRVLKGGKARRRGLREAHLGSPSCGWRHQARTGARRRQSQPIRRQRRDPTRLSQKSPVRGDIRPPPAYHLMPSPPLSARSHAQLTAGHRSPMAGIFLVCRLANGR